MNLVCQPAELPLYNFWEDQHLSSWLDCLNENCCCKWLFGWLFGRKKVADTLFNELPGSFPGVLGDHRSHTKYTPNIEDNG